MTKATQDVYWAATPVDDGLGGKVQSRFDKYRIELSRARGRRIRHASLRYFGFDPDDGAGRSDDLELGGEEGEGVLAQVNHFRSLVRSMRALATSSRPAFDAVASDDSADSAAACELAEQIWDQELDLGLEGVLGRADDRMLVQGEAAIGVFWEPDQGTITGAEPLFERDPRTGDARVDDMGQPVPQLDGSGAPQVRPIYDGGVCYEVFGPADCARDTEVPDMRRVPWVIVRRRVHRWDLLAGINPASKIWQVVKGAPGPRHASGGAPMRDGDSITAGQTDMVWALELYHERTPALPEGRYVRVVAGEVIDEGPLAYETIPVVLRAPAEEFDRAAGYTDAWDLMGLSKAIDLIVSDLISHSERFGQMPALIPEGADIDVSQLVNGGEVRYKWQQGMPPPTWMAPPQMGDGFFKILEWMEKTLQVLSGVNSVVRGDPEASLKSGAALALVQAMAVQHASAFQACAADMRRTVATKVIEVYRAFATGDRLLELSGEERGTVRMFQASQLGPVRRIRATLANPLLRTIAGKKEVLDDLMGKFQNEPPITRAQYLEFLETGRWAPVFRADEAQMRLVTSENDRLVKGEDVEMRLLDHHETHIREHNAIIDGRARYEMPVEQLAMIEAHITEHGQTWVMLTQTNPALLAATNQRPAPMPMMPPPGPPDAGGPGAPPPSGGGEQPSALQPPAGGEPPIPGTGPEAASMPKAPINPATGERVQLPPGAAA